MSNLIAIRNVSYSDKRGIYLYLSNGERIKISNISDYEIDFPQLKELFSRVYIYPNNIGERYIFTNKKLKGFLKYENPGNTLYVKSDKKQLFDKMFYKEIF